MTRARRPARQAAYLLCRRCHTRLDKILNAVGIHPWCAEEEDAETEARRRKETGQW